MWTFTKQILLVNVLKDTVKNEIRTLSDRRCMPVTPRHAARFGNWSCCCWPGINYGCTVPLSNNKVFSVNLVRFQFWQQFYSTIVELVPRYRNVIKQFIMAQQLYAKMRSEIFKFTCAFFKYLRWSWPKFVSVLEPIVTFIAWPRDRISAY